MTRSFLSAFGLLIALVGPASGQATTPTKPEPAKADAGKPAAPAANPDVEKALELFKQQKVGDALEALKKAQKANPTMVPKLQLASWFLQANSMQNARAYIEQAIADDPGHPEAYLFNANIAYNEGRVTDAILNLLRVKEQAMNTRWEADQKKRFLREAQYGLARCFQTRNDFEAAKENVIALLKDDPKNGPLRSQLAELLFRTGRTEEAFRELTQAFADEPTLDPPDLRMAALWQFQSNSQADPVKAEADRKEAEKSLQAANQKFPKSAKCKREYAVWLMEDGRADAAKTYIEAAEQLDPTGRDTKATRALWHLYKKEYPAAEAILQKIMESAPGDAFAIGYRCLALAESGDETKKQLAIDLAETLVKQNQKSALPYAIAGWCLIKKGRLDDADKMLGAAVSAGQVTFDTAYFMAYLFNEKGKYEEAQNLLKTAVAAPHGPFVYRNEAKALLADVTKKVPPKKPDEPKKEEPKK